MHMADALLSPSSDEVPSPTRQMRECARLLEKAARYVPSMEGLSERLTSARLELEDIAAEVATAAARIDVSPQRLEQVEDRLSLLYGLFQKYGATSVEELMSERDRLKGLVLDASSLTEEVEASRKALEDATKRHTALCDQLHAKRLAGAEPFAAAVEDAGIDAVLSAIEKIRASPFLKGANRKNWVVTFEWFVRPNNFPKVLEGNYDENGTAETVKTSNPFLAMLLEENCQGDGFPDNIRGTF